MPPQAIFVATCHVTPLGTAPDRRNTVLGPDPKWVRQLRTRSPRPNLSAPMPAAAAGMRMRRVDEHRGPSPETAPRISARLREAGAVRASEAIGVGFAGTRMEEAFR
jgi:hypothetical protein